MSVKINSSVHVILNSLIQRSSILINKNNIVTANVVTLFYMYFKYIIQL